MNQLTWHFGFADEEKIAENEKKGYLFDNTYEALADQYAEDAIDHLSRMLSDEGKPNRVDTIEYLRNLFDVDSLFVGSSHKEFTNDVKTILKLLFRGHIIELERESWFKSYLEDPSKCSYLSAFFDYGKWNNMSKDKNWRRKIMIASGVAICPYCDRQYITSFSVSIELGNDKKTLATLDHFYTKSKYPLFALSLFNFVPACYGCNSVIRGEQPLKIYPYRPGYSDLTRFVLKTRKTEKNSMEVDDSSNNGSPIEEMVDIILGKEETPLSIEKTVNSILPDGIISDDVSADIETLKISEVYAIHQDYVKELLLIRRFYENSEYCDYVTKLLNNTIFADIDFRYPVTIDMLRRFLIGADWLRDNEDGTNPHKRPLSNLTNAIMHDEYKILFAK